MYGADGFMSLLMCAGSFLQRQAEGSGGLGSEALMPSTCTTLPEDVEAIFETAIGLSMQDGCLGAALCRYKAATASLSVSNQ